MANMIQGVIGSTGYEHFFMTTGSSGSGGGGTAGTCNGTVVEGYQLGSIGSISVPRYRNMPFQSITTSTTYEWNAEEDPQVCQVFGVSSTITFDIGTNSVDENFFSRIELYSGSVLIQRVLRTGTTYLGSGVWQLNGFQASWSFGDNIRIYY